MSPSSFVNAPDPTAATLLATLDTQLRHLLHERAMPEDLREAMLYASLGPGKRIRPLLMLRAFEAVAGPLTLPNDAQASDQPLWRAACAMEMIHAFSLVHDDLPAMDDDDLRRGRPTLHRHTTEAMAILAGDGLLAYALETVAGSAAEPTLVVALVQELTKAAGDMIAGQVCDTFPRDGNCQEQTPPQRDALGLLVETHRLKTGALLRGSARIGALCGDASPQQLAALTRYADDLGLMFQVVDDLLDVTAEAAAVGKATGKDAAAGKQTYPGLLGVDGARAEVQRLSAAALGALEGFGSPAEALRQLVRDLAVRQR